MNMLQRVRVGILAALSSSEVSEGGRERPEPEDVPAVSLDTLSSDDVAQVDSSELEQAVLDLKKKSDWFYSRIESILNERDQWKRIFFDEVAGHQAAQALYETSLLRERQWLLNAIVIINQYRLKGGEPLMERPFVELWDPPVDQNERYLKLVASLVGTGPKFVDHMKDVANFVGNHVRDDGSVHTAFCINRWNITHRCSCLGPGV